MTKSTGRSRSGAGSEAVGKPSPAMPKGTSWAAGWEQGSQLAENMPDDQEWVDGWLAGYNEVMDRRFPERRTPVDGADRDDESA